MLKSNKKKIKNIKGAGLMISRPRSIRSSRINPIVESELTLADIKRLIIEKYNKYGLEISLDNRDLTQFMLHNLFLGNINHRYSHLITMRITNFRKFIESIDLIMIECSNDEQMLINQTFIAHIAAIPRYFNTDSAGSQSLIQTRENFYKDKYTQYIYNKWIENSEINSLEIADMERLKRLSFNNIVKIYNLLHKYKTPKDFNLIKLFINYPQLRNINIQLEQMRFLGELDYTQIAHIINEQSRNNNLANWIIENEASYRSRSRNRSRSRILGSISLSSRRARVEPSEFSSISNMQ